MESRPKITKLLRCNGKRDSNSGKLMLNPITSVMGSEIRTILSIPESFCNYLHRALRASVPQFTRTVDSCRLLKKGN